MSNEMQKVDFGAVISQSLKDMQDGLVSLKDEYDATSKRLQQLTLMIAEQHGAIKGVEETLKRIDAAAKAAEVAISEPEPDNLITKEIEPQDIK